MIAMSLQTPTILTSDQPELSVWWQSPGSFCWKPSVRLRRHFGEVEAFGEDSPNGGRLARQQMKTTETRSFVVNDGSANQSNRKLLICKCSEL